VAQERRNKLPSGRLSFVVVAALLLVGALVLTTAGGTSNRGLQVRSVSPSTLRPIPLQVQPVPASGATPGPERISIPSAPSGEVGSVTNPLGSPAESLPGCAADAVVPQAALAVNLTSAGFSAKCYTVSATGATSVVLTDGLTNTGTGLTIAADVTVSTVLNPVVSQVAKRAAQLPGLTVPSQPDADVNLRNAIFTSPTAADGSPVMFSLPALPAGQYLLQLPTQPALPAAVLTVVPAAAQFSGPSPAPAGGSRLPNVPGAAVLQPTAADQGALEGAFGSWEHLPKTCGAAIVPGSELIAQISADGTEWATAQFRPAQSCAYVLAPAGPGLPPRSVAPDMIGPFAETPGPPVGVFEKSPGGAWLMNQEGGRPYPCPASGGVTPGPGNGALPASVLTAWGLTYAPDCAFPVYPPQPRS